MSTMAAERNSTGILFATVATIATLPVSFLVFRRGLIRFWEWQHDGRRMIFVIGPEMTAPVLAIFVSLLVFSILLLRLMRPRP